MRFCWHGQESEDPARARGSGSAGGVDRQWQHAAEACPARPDRDSGRRGYRNRRDSASIGGEQTGHSALADALCRGRRGRLVPRQDATARQGAAGGRGGQSGAQQDADGSAAERHPLEPAYDGQGRGHRAVERSGDLESTWLEATPGGGLQAIERPAICREGRGCRGLVSQPAGARHRPVGGREIPDPGARPHPAGPAHEEGSGRNHDPRLQAPRYHRFSSPRPTCSRAG